MHVTVSSPSLDDTVACHDRGGHVERDGLGGGREENAVLPGMHGKGSGEEQQVAGSHCQEQLLVRNIVHWQ